jgi:5-methylcytosine-specific restriction enzyme A
MGKPPRLRMLRPAVAELGSTPREPGRSGWTPDARRGNRHQRGYGTAWEKLRARILRRDSYLCQPCLQAGRTTAAEAVDHIIPKARGGTDDARNLRAICGPCHREKTARESVQGRGG